MSVGGKGSARASRFGSAARLTAGVLGLIVAVGGVAALVLGREFLEGAALLGLGFAGLYAAVRGREPRGFRS